MNLTILNRAIFKRARELQDSVNEKIEGCHKGCIEVPEAVAFDSMRAMCLAEVGNVIRMYVEMEQEGK